MDPLITAKNKLKLAIATYIAAQLQEGKITYDDLKGISRDTLSGLENLTEMGQLELFADLLALKWPIMAKFSTNSIAIATNEENNKDEQMASIRSKLLSLTQ